MNPSLADDALAAESTHPLAGGLADLWLAQNRDCSGEPMGLSPEKASFLLKVHAGHGPGCRQYLAAAAFRSNLADTAAPG